MNLLNVTDPDDPRIAAFRDIRERDLVGRENRFIAEGEVVLRGLVQSARHRPLEVLIDAKRAEKLRPLLEALPPGVPVYGAGQEVIDQIAGFHLHRGILALGQSAPARPVSELLAQLPEKALVLVLKAIANHDNMGGLFRNAAAFGADAVLLDAESCDPLYRKSIRVSVGSVLTVPYARLMDGEDVLGLLEHSGFRTFSLSPRGEVALADVVPPQRSALVFGAEGMGLPEEFLTRTQTVSIPMAGGFDSLNVATSSGIVLHHFAQPFFSRK
ncbi:RNA methyltransferase [Terrihabitans soli]|uniref:RNA methyltransferase n=1 Tax=Terrihabitans soli TaxID=708113 RepID=A0A6S6QY98_9HYPH|nr:RNA methyltransferase [Terrihabitans soli]BCJ91548.1 RNA methyltransferase [Terrihabitans soli]